MTDIEKQVLVSTQEPDAVNDDRGDPNLQAREEVNRGVTVEHEMETVSCATSKNSVKEQDATEYSFDVFISYNSHDRPWVRDVLLTTLERLGKKVYIDYKDFSVGAPIADNISHAIQSSRVTIIVLTPSYLESQWCHYEIQQALVTSQGRVLPLILIDCVMPRILKHVTYLDVTNDDVQPFFMDRLNESLELADKWTVCYDVFNDETIENKVQNVLTKNKKAKKAAEKARIIVRIIKFLLCFPCTLALLTFIFYSLVLTASFILYTTNPRQVRDMYLEIPNKAVASFIPNLIFSQALTIKSLRQPKWKFDIFLFAGRSENFRIHRKVETSLKQFSLKPKSYQTIYNLNWGMKLESNFCFNKSNSTEGMRFYKVYESRMDNFKSYWLGNDRSDSSSFELKKRFSLSQNVSKCHFITINATSLSSREINLVLANTGKTSVSAVVNSSLYKPFLNKEGSFKTCLNTTYCMLPYRKVNYYAFIVRNASLSFSNEIEVRCIARVTTIAIFTLIDVFCFVGYYLLMKFFFLGVCFKHAKRFCAQCISNEDVRKQFMKI